MILICIIIIKLFVCSSQETHFVRCIKPNNVRSSFFDENFVLQQLKSSGNIAFFQLMKNGYPERKIMQDLYTNFGQYFKSTYGDVTEFTFELLRTCGFKKNDFKIGNTEVFFRANKRQKLDKLLSAAPDAINSIIVRREKIKTMWRSALIKLTLLRYKCML